MRSILTYPENEQAMAEGEGLIHKNLLSNLRHQPLLDYVKCVDIIGWEVNTINIHASGVGLNGYHL